MAALHSILLQLIAFFMSLMTISAWSPGTSTDGYGFEHCMKCGNATDSGLARDNISHCLLKQVDTSHIIRSKFSCECRVGFTGDGITCNDFDECKAMTDNCDWHAICSNTPGAFNCACINGYYGTGVTCTDIDECAEAGSEKNASDIYCNGVGNCVNTPGSYRCECGTGYVPDVNGTSCIDENECARDNICEQQCVNTVGSYYCSCYAGFEPQDPSAPGVGCVNINECERVAALCGENTLCHDTNGSYTCHCYRGFEWEHHPMKRHCVDIDECEQTPSFDCSPYPNTECHNSYGSAECVCLKGYRGPKDNCENINECAEGTATCAKNASCVDTYGSYYCACNAGFTGNGSYCAAINECVEGTARCDANASCVDTSEGYYCACNLGFAGNGTYCEDIDECNREFTNQCDPNAVCNNTIGLYTCTCINGYIGDGYNCSADPSMNKDKGQTSHSALLYKYQRLNQERLQLVLKHEEILKRCVNLLQGKQLQAVLARREVIDGNVKSVESLQDMIIILEKRNTELALENHRLDLNCSE